MVHTGNYRLEIFVEKVRRERISSAQKLKFTFRISFPFDCTSLSLLLVFPKQIDLEKLSAAPTAAENREEMRRGSLGVAGQAQRWLSHLT